MPDGAPTAAAGNSRGIDPGDKPDRVGEELADDARIWRVYDRIAKEDDDRRIQTWNRGLDNLALFAGLFSAVTTAFIIESQSDMKPDYSQLTFQVLNATAFKQPLVPEPFVVPSSARAINRLWVASLVLSLSAALIAIMGKDWIGMYASRLVCNPRQWAEMRTSRLSPYIPSWARYMRKSGVGSTGVSIVAEIARHIVCLLGDARMARSGEMLFELLAFSEAKLAEGGTSTWNLGNWIWNIAPYIRREYSDTTTAFKNFHEAMIDIYALRSKSSAVAVVWDSIGYPGRPGDTFSDPFLRLGAFFKNAEHTPLQTSERTRLRAARDIFSCSSLDLSVFFAVAEAPRQRPKDFFSHGSARLGAFFHMAERVDPNGDRPSGR
ncbi:hypothetical protein AURDEDRAFT_159189 [Auricularia subglabra TFB-10046 SS5]|nr:hypothetical protein AURDEDRAFT_159189 [Auricularia subglabra TFB-10046 SS5]